MGLTLLTIFLCCLLKSSLQITSKTKLTSTFSSKHSLKSIADYGRTFPLDPIDEIKLFCGEDDDCSWLKNSSCISMRCICKKNFININNACFERRFLGDDCLFSEECSTYNSYCMNNICSCKLNYKNIANATCMLDFSEICKDDCAWIENSYCDSNIKMGCVCKDSYILIDEKCYKKGFLNDDCSYSDQCQASNSLCLKNKCSCKPGYRANQDNSFCFLDIAVSLGDDCEDSSQCNALNSYCHPYGYCECKTGYARNGDICKSIYQIPLGGDCEDSSQCKTLNSYCHPYGYCECKTGYTRNGAICKSTYQIIPVKKNYQMNTFIIVICIGSVLIAGIFIIVLIFAVRKRLFDIQSRRTQRSNVPELGITAFNSNCSTIETTLEELDKPPSYEDVMGISQSSNNLMSNEVLPQPSCPGYSESMQQRSRSSSM